MKANNPELAQCQDRSMNPFFYLVRSARTDSKRAQLVDIHRSQSILEALQASFKVRKTIMADDVARWNVPEAAVTRKDCRMSLRNVIVSSLWHHPELKSVDIHRSQSTRRAQIG